MPEVKTRREHAVEEIASIKSIGRGVIQSGHRGTDLFTRYKVSFKTSELRIIDLISFCRSTLDGMEATPGIITMNMGEKLSPKGPLPEITFTLESSGISDKHIAEIVEDQIAVIAKKIEAKFLTKMPELRSDDQITAQGG